MDRPDDRQVRRFQIVVGSGRTDDARLLRPAGRFWRLKAMLVSLAMAAAVIGFVIAALVLGSIIALLLLGVVSIAFLVALIRSAFRRRL